MRRRLVPPAVLAALAIAATLAGCGGSSLDYEEVPGRPPELTLPEGSPGTASSNDNGSTTTTDENATPTPTATATAAPTTSGTGGTGGATGGTGTTGTTGGTSAPGGTSNGTGGSDPQFEDFCQQNPGAC